MNLEPTFQAAAAALQDTETLVITAGAGMGVDSGLPDFRGDEGFWNAYPPYRKLGLSFVDAANPEHFERDPAFGWGFYGHRTNLYRATVPHPGFAQLLQWGERLEHFFVVTSNVDGQFQKAGFPEERIVEVHGSIHHLQCTTPCSMNLWPNDESIPVNEATMRARAIPRCRHCGAIARPNILMFGDGAWIARRSEAQQQRYLDFLAARRGTKTVVIEMGAGTAIPTIRAASERLGFSHKATVIRINPREPRIDAPHLSLPCGAVEGLNGIAAKLQH
jgi:NAD-dependent SIR2 family protein deacetylase